MPAEPVVKGLTDFERGLLLNFIAFQVAALGIESHSEEEKILLQIYAMFRREFGLRDRQFIHEAIAEASKEAGH